MSLRIEHSGIDEGVIARRAYVLWELRGRPFGSPQTDWQEAIRELRSEMSIADDRSEPPFSAYHMEPDEA